MSWSVPGSEAPASEHRHRSVAGGDGRSPIELVVDADFDDRIVEFGVAGGDRRAVGELKRAQDALEVVVQELGARRPIGGDHPLVADAYDRSGLNLACSEMRGGAGV